MATRLERPRGLVSNRAANARIDVWTFPPPPELADVVAHTWRLRWRDEPGQLARLISEPCLNLCHEVAEPVVAEPLRLVGAWTTIWERWVVGSGEIRAVKLKAGAARAFVDDASVWTDRVAPLAEGFADLPDVGESGFDGWNRWLARHRRHHPETSLAVALCETIRTEPDLMRVEQLVTRGGVGARSLQRLFRVHVGASPKFVIRRYRLQEAAARIERGDVPVLADLAHELGYADQAHLTRDFKALVNVAPSVFAREVRR